MIYYSSKQLALSISSFLYVFIILLLIPNSLAQSQKPIFPLTPTSIVHGTQSVVGDFNGDGKPDLAYVAISGSSSSAVLSISLNVLLSFGSSSQTAAIATPLCTTTSSAVWFAPGDINKDGKLDFVTAAVATLRL